jgi:hypothetical protein
VVEGIPNSELITNLILVVGEVVFERPTHILMSSTAVGLYQNYLMDDGEGNSREKDKIKEIELPPRPPPPGLLPSLDCTPEMMRLMIMKQDISSSLNNIIISLRSPYTR